MRLRQNGGQFADDIFECIFLNEFSWMIKISLNFVPKGPINNIPALGNGLVPTRQQDIIWTNDGYITKHMRHPASMN